MSEINSDELIFIPSFLSNSSTVSARASACGTYLSSCGTHQCTSGCQAEQDGEPCNTLAMTCGNSQNDCGACQNGGETCGVSEYGSCDSCQGFSECATCERECMKTCERYSQDPSCDDECEYAAQESPIDVAYWSWSESNGEATGSQTRAAYDAVRNHGEVSDFSYLVWNDLVNKILEIKQYAGFEWNAYFDLYENTLMSEDERTLTALKFNSARYNIGIHMSTTSDNYPDGIQPVSRGDKVMGEYFIIIARCINDFIDKIAEEMGEI